MSTYKPKKNRAQIQAWLHTDPQKNERHALAVEIWEHYRQENDGRTANTLAEALIALNEKNSGGFDIVPDDSPIIAKRLRDSIYSLETVVKRLSSIDFQSATLAQDIADVQVEVSDAVQQIDFNIVSDSMSFSDDEDDSY
jgi:hypothetical protein